MIRVMSQVRNPSYLLSKRKELSKQPSSPSSRALTRIRPCLTQAPYQSQSRSDHPWLTPPLPGGGTVMSWVLGLLNQSLSSYPTISSRTQGTCNRPWKRKPSMKLSKRIWCCITWQRWLPLQGEMLSETPLLLYRPTIRWPRLTTWESYRRSRLRIIWLLLPIRRLWLGMGSCIYRRIRISCCKSCGLRLCLRPSRKIKKSW